MTFVKGVGRPVHEDGATEESSDAKGAVVHEGLLGQGCNSFQFAPYHKHPKQVNGRLMICNHHTSLWSLQQICFPPYLYDE